MCFPGAFDQWPRETVGRKTFFVQALQIEGETPSTAGEDGLPGGLTALTVKKTYGERRTRQRGVFGGFPTKWHSWRLPGDSTFRANYRGSHVGPIWDGRATTTGRCRPCGRSYRLLPETVGQKTYMARALQIEGETPSTAGEDGLPGGLTALTDKKRTYFSF